MVFETLPTQLRPALVLGLQKVWKDIAAPGTWWSGADRVAIATVARGQLDSEIPAAAQEAAQVIYSDITTVSREWVDGLLMSGLEVARYVEIVGIVSRLAAVDEFVRAIGGDLEPLPIPSAGDPSREPSPTAGDGPLWVPMVGEVSITRALSIVPAESESQRALYGPLYMSYEEMADNRFERELSRPQMELVAARTSAINECFY